MSHQANILIVRAYLLLIFCSCMIALNAGLQDGVIAYKNGNFPKALKEFSKCAAQGDLAAIFNLGCMYKNGDGVEQDLNTALSYFRRAENAGFKAAKEHIDEIEAYMKEQRGATQEVFAMPDQGKNQGFNSSASPEFLAATSAYEKGLVLESLGLCQKAAEKGEAWGQNGFGTMLLLGWGGTRDEKKAIQWFEKAANQNFPEAQYNLALIYRKGVYGVPENVAIAINWLQKAADLGYAKAQYRLGWLLEKGQDEGVKKDLKQAAKWYLLAANQGYAEAQTILGTMYYNGDGVEQDYKKAFNLYRQAAEQNFSKAQYNLGLLYAQGRGVQIDYEQSFMWAQIAWLRGDRSDGGQTILMDISKANLSSIQLAKTRELAEKKYSELQTLFNSVARPCNFCEQVFVEPGRY